MKVYEVHEYDPMASNWGEWGVTKRFKSKAKADAYVASENEKADKNWREQCGRDEPYPWPSYIEEAKID